MHSVSGVALPCLKSQRGRGIAPGYPNPIPDLPGITHDDRAGGERERADVLHAVGCEDDRDPTEQRAGEMARHEARLGRYGIRRGEPVEFTELERFLIGCIA